MGDPFARRLAYNGATRPTPWRFDVEGGVEGHGPVEVTSTSAARIFGLYPRKGAIQVGADADLGLEKTVTRELYGTWSDYNLYTGVKLRGWPVVTMLRGRVVVRDGAVRVAPGYGRFLPRQARRRQIARPMVSE